MGGSEEEEEGERTRFPCLASLRTLVATVVTALAVVVVVMVILVLHRPEKIVFTSYGYVQSQDQWWTTEAAAHPARNIPVDDGILVNPQTVTELIDYPAAQVTILLIMFAYNPSGRGKVDCNITSITVADMANSTTDMTEIKTVLFPPENRVAFSVRPQSWHRDRRQPVKINDTNVLNYLCDKHSRQSRFRVMTQVNVTYKPLHSGNDKWSNATYYCWPVYFVYGPQDIPGGEVLCKTAEQMDSPVSLKPAPAAPPPPAKAPPGGPS